MKKVNKVTVGTRITIPLKSKLEEEASNQNLTFCRYLEYLLINRDAIAERSPTSLKNDLQIVKTERDSLQEEVKDLKDVIAYLEDDFEEDDEELVETDKQDLLEKIKTLENQVIALKEENFVLQTLEEESEEEMYEENLKKVDSSENSEQALHENNLQREHLFIENQALKNQIKEKEDELVSDAIRFLEEKHSTLSKEDIIKIALECTAVNDGKKWHHRMFSFTDYLKQGISFINYQNN